MTAVSANPTIRIAALTGCVVLAACQGGIESYFPKAEAPISAELQEAMKEKGMTAASPIYIRVFKKENIAEVWKETDSGRYGLLAEFEICKWSGRLGPKFKEGDRQAPEGFYTINPYQMNPNSEYHLSFNLGFPNAYDRAHKRTGSHLMMHGACSSAGCYSMTDERIEEIYALAREAFEGGQKAFEVHAFPFRMTPENMVEYKDHAHYEFWRMLKEGYDHFEITNAPPKVDVCGKRYVFNRIPEEDSKFKATEPCPPMSMPETLALAYAEKQSKDAEIFEQVLKKKARRDAWLAASSKREASGVETAALAAENPEDIEIAADPTMAGIDPSDPERLWSPNQVPFPEKSPLVRQQTRQAETSRATGFLARLFRRNAD